MRFRSGRRNLRRSGMLERSPDVRPKARRAPGQSARVGADAKNPPRRGPAEFRPRRRGNMCHPQKPGVRPARTGRASRAGWQTFLRALFRAARAALRKTPVAGTPPTGSADERPAPGLRSPSGAAVRDKPSVRNHAACLRDSKNAAHDCCPGLGLLVEAGRGRRSPNARSHDCRGPRRLRRRRRRAFSCRRFRLGQHAACRLQRRCAEGPRPRPRRGRLGSAGRHGPHARHGPRRAPQRRRRKAAGTGASGNHRRKKLSPGPASRAAWWNSWAKFRSAWRASFPAAPRAVPAICGTCCANAAWTPCPSSRSPACCSASFSPS